MASPSLLPLPYLLTPFLLLLFPLFPTTSSSNISSSTLYPNNVQSFCHFTPYPASCLESQKFSISISVSSNSPTVTSALCSLQAAVSDGTKLSSLLCSISPGPKLVESQKGSLQDCRDLHQITLSSLKKSMDTLSSYGDGNSCNLGDVRTYLSAALTNNATCLEGLAGARGSLKPTLVASWSTAYEHVSNSLDLVTRLGPQQPGGRRRRLLSSAVSRDGFPSWVSPRDRRLLQNDDYGDGDGDGDGRLRGVQPVVGGDGGCGRDGQLHDGGGSNRVRAEQQRGPHNRVGAGGSLRGERGDHDRQTQHCADWGWQQRDGDQRKPERRRRLDHLSISHSRWVIFFISLIFFL